MMVDNRGLYAFAQQQPVEADAFVAQRVALVHADHRGRKANHVFAAGETRLEAEGAGGTGR